MRYSISGSKRYSPGGNIKKSFMNTTDERSILFFFYVFFVDLK
jgi:hypothetical protein